MACRRSRADGSHVSSALPTARTSPRGKSLRRRRGRGLIAAGGVSPDSPIGASRGPAPPQPFETLPRRASPRVGSRSRRTPGPRHSSRTMMRNCRGHRHVRAGVGDALGGDPAVYLPAGHEPARSSGAASTRFVPKVRRSAAALGPDQQPVGAPIRAKDPRIWRARRGGRAPRCEGRTRRPPHARTLAR